MSGLLGQLHVFQSKCHDPQDDAQIRFGQTSLIQKCLKIISQTVIRKKVMNEAKSPLRKDRTHHGRRAEIISAVAFAGWIQTVSLEAG